jgi:hypothetical protein
MIEKAILASPWSPLLERYVLDGFAPTRKGNRVRICIDGEMFFRNLAEELNKA